VPGFTGELSLYQSNHTYKNTEWWCSIPSSPRVLMPGAGSPIGPHPQTCNASKSSCYVLARTKYDFCMNKYCGGSLPAPNCSDKCVSGWQSDIQNCQIKYTGKCSSGNLCNPSSQGPHQDGLCCPPGTRACKGPKGMRCLGCPPGKRPDIATCECSRCPGDNECRDGHCCIKDSQFPDCCHQTCCLASERCCAGWVDGKVKGFCCSQSAKCCPWGLADPKTWRPCCFPGQRCCPGGCCPECLANEQPCGDACCKTSEGEFCSNGSCCTGQTFGCFGGCCPNGTACCAGPGVTGDPKATFHCCDGPDPKCCGKGCCHGNEKCNPNVPSCG
jgi:hypothetical protein